MATVAQRQNSSCTFHLNDGLDQGRWWRRERCEGAARYDLLTGCSVAEAAICQAGALTSQVLTTLMYIHYSQFGCTLFKSASLAQ